MVTNPNWVVIWAINGEYYFRRSRGNKVKRYRPVHYRQYGPVIHIHDKTTREIIHFYAGPYDDSSLFELQRKLAGIRDAYQKFTYVDSIKLILITDTNDVVPDWFSPTTSAMMPKMSAMTSSSYSFIEIEGRGVTIIRIPVAPYRGDLDPGPGWNGIPSSRTGGCEPNLLINLGITLDFGPMMESLEDCQRRRAEAAARDQLREEGANPVLIDIPPPELIQQHLERLQREGYAHCAQDFVCPILWRAQTHHEDCKHDVILIRVPSQLAQQLEEIPCWNDFVRFLDGTGVEWTTEIV